MAEIQLDAPGLARIVTRLEALLRQDVQVRALQSQNALQAKYFDQPSGGVTGATVYRINEAQQRQNEVFAFLVLAFDALSGSGRYRIDGIMPTAAIGIPLAAGFNVYTIPGNDNIRNFGMMAEAGQTLSFARYLLV